MKRVDFSGIPQLRFNRSKFDMPHSVKTSFNLGQLVPISWVEVLPGDTFSTEMLAVVRSTTPFIKPIMDSLYMDVYHFYVPYRAVFSDVDSVFGNPNPSAYSNNNLVELPHMVGNTKSVAVPPNTVLDYLGVQPNCPLPDGFSVMLPRAFALIYDKWFRNENTVPETYIHKGAWNSTDEKPNTNAWSPSNYFGQLPYVSKKKDYFTSSLPQTQKGSAVNIPLGTSAPVRTGAMSSGTSTYPLMWAESGTSVFTPANKGNIGIYDSVGSSGLKADSTFVADYGVFPSNLYTDLSNAIAPNVNDLRFAFQLQKMLERDALYGSRYNEYLLGHFGVQSNDLDILVPEYLGGGKFPIEIQQVAQTAPTSTTPLAGLGAFSWSNGRSKFYKSFKQHGFVITVGCVRQLHTYSQGIPKAFYRTKRNDMYDPLFANLGEQPVYSCELFTPGVVAIDDPVDYKANVFGYQEAWADYRYIPNRVTGKMRDNTNLTIWHLADKYANAPTMSESFTNENTTNIDRVLSVPSSSIPNFIAEFGFDTKAIRPMPVYSVPGFIDHH